MFDLLAALRSGVRTLLGSDNPPPLSLLSDITTSQLPFSFGFTSRSETSATLLSAPTDRFEFASSDPFSERTSATAKDDKFGHSLDSKRHHTYDGGAGTDQIFISEKYSPTVKLAHIKITARPDGGFDVGHNLTIYNIEIIKFSIDKLKVTGSNRADYIWLHHSFECTLSGGGGNDTIDANFIADFEIYGGSGNDLIYGAPGSVYDGGPGRDTFSLKNDYWPSALTLLDGGFGFYYSPTLNYGSPAPETMTKIFKFENLSGWHGNDTLTGNSKANVLRGDLGEDWLLPKGGNDTLIGGDDYDVLVIDALPGHIVIDSTGQNLRQMDELRISRLLTDGRMNADRVWDVYLKYTYDGPMLDFGDTTVLFLHNYPRNYVLEVF